MRRVAYALIASGALMLGAPTSASAGCYGDDCYDGGYHRTSGPSYEHERYYDRPSYRSYYRDGGCGNDCGYDRPRYHTTYYERPSYGGYYDHYTAGSRSYYRSSCDYGSSCGSSYRYSSGCGDYGYSSCGGSYRTSYSSGCGGYSGCGYGYRRSYSGYGYGGYGYGYPIVRYGGAWMQTGH